MRYVAHYQGEEFTRTSHRTYTHAVIVDGIGSGEPGTYSWAGSLKLAEAKAREASRSYPGAKIEIVEVTVQAK